MPTYKFNEDEVLRQLTKYIDSTYSEHYTNKNNNVQALDVYQARGTLTNTAIDNAIKYLMRYGKKEGLNRKDLLKSLHYIVIALGNELLIEDAVIEYVPEIAHAKVEILHGVQYQLIVTFTNGTQVKIDMLKTLKEPQYEYLWGDKFASTFGFSPYIVQWDDYWLEYTAEELFIMGEEYVYDTK